VSIRCVPRPLGSLWLRFLRIYPGFWLAVAVVVVLNWMVFGSFAWNRGTIFGLTLLPLGDGLTARPALDGARDDEAGNREKDENAELR
jgi:hypothetical protein